MYIENGLLSDDITKITEKSQKVVFTIILNIKIISLVY